MFFFNFKINPQLSENQEFKPTYVVSNIVKNKFESKSQRICSWLILWSGCV